MSYAVRLGGPYRADKRHRTLLLYILRLWMQEPIGGNRTEADFSQKSGFGLLSS